MAALAVDYRDIELLDWTRIGEADMCASDIIYKNSLLGWAATGIGLAPLSTSYIFAGIAFEQVENAVATIGAKRVKYYINPIGLVRGIATIARANEGDLIYAANTDNPADLTVVSTSNIAVGTIIEFKTTTSAVIDFGRRA